MKRKMLLTLAAAAAAGLAASSVAVAHDPPGQGKKDDNATTAAATTSASSASKPKPKNFTAKLRGANEKPTAVTTDAVGRAKMRLHNGNLLYFVNASNFAEGNLVTAAHIHCGGVDQTGPAVVTLFSDAGKAVNGRFAKGSVPAGPLVPTESTSCPLDIPGDDDEKVDSLDDLLWLMRNGYAYVNVHTTVNAGGEIRGQIKPLGPKS